MSTSTVFVYTLSQAGQPGKWSRYLFPFEIDDFTQLDDDLYIRSGDNIIQYDPAGTQDLVNTPQVGVFEGIVWWPFLDMGQPGVLKQLIAVDVICTGSNPSISMGYDETNPLAYTAPFSLPPDTVPGMVIPLPITSPSMSLQLTFPGGAPWRVLASNLYLQDQRVTS